jgi:hypothetical protein
MHGPLNVTYSPEYPISLAYRVLQTTHVVHFKFLRVCLPFWLAASWNQEKWQLPTACLDKTHDSHVREVAAAARREPVTAVERESQKFSAIEWYRSEVLIAIALFTYYGEFLWLSN